MTETETVKADNAEHIPTIFWNPSNKIDWIVKATLRMSYTYDHDQRITGVSTRSDGVIWENDASYKYFAHGPLQIIPNPTYLYNGNISSWAWSNRLRSDSVRKWDATSWAGSIYGDWHSNYTYDGNGNIETLYRNNQSSSQMDNLTYAYQSGTNKLTHVDDAQGAS